LKKHFEKKGPTPEEHRLLAEKYIEREEVAIDKERAELYYKLAIAENHLEAAYNYAIKLCEGTFGENRKKESEEFYLKAIKGSHILAADNYALFICKGTSGEPDIPKAMKYFKFSADRGHSDAQTQYQALLKQGIQIAST
jgi:TPR repeat protein